MSQAEPSSCVTTVPTVSDHAGPGIAPTPSTSLSKDLLSALQAELDAIAASDTVRVVVIAGAGKASARGTT